uniref:Uncharacterized protein n=1 Tax=Serinus canaria TaxID=9135 RepID=A0A8C9ML77_SERCA
IHRSRGYHRAGLPRFPRRSRGRSRMPALELGRAGHRPRPGAGRDRAVSGCKSLLGLGCAAGEGSRAGSRRCGQEGTVHFYLLFWYHVFTCVSVRLREAASSILSCTLRYFCLSKLRSSWASVLGDVTPQQATPRSLINGN